MIDLNFSGLEAKYSRILEFLGILMVGSFSFSCSVEIEEEFIRRIKKKSNRKKSYNKKEYLKKINNFYFFEKIF